MQPVETTYLLLLQSAWNQAGDRGSCGAASPWGSSACGELLSQQHLFQLWIHLLFAVKILRQVGTTSRNVIESNNDTG